MTQRRSGKRRLAALPACLDALRQDRRGAVAMMLALATLAVLPLIGLAVDFAFISQARAQLDSAADTAALTAAKTAGAAFVANVPGAATPASQGQTAGGAWFTAQVGTIPDAAIVGTPTVTVTPNNNAFTATVTYTASITTVFHQFFGITSVTVSNTASALIVANAYVDVTFLLDNSSSMLIAATDSGSGTANGVATLQPLTAAASCPQANVSYSTSTKRGVANAGCSSDVGTTSACTTTTYSTPSSGQQPVTLDSSANTLGGCQCAFACHWQPATGSTTFTARGVNTETGAPNTGNTTQTYSLDYYGIARANGVQLRYDVVQSAVVTAIGYMQTSEEIAHQFGASVYQFNSSLQQVWPPTADSATQAITDMACLQVTASGCNGNALAAAAAITTPVLPDEADTNFPAAMTALVTQSRAALTAAGLTVAGDGSTQAKAKRSLIIVTDGIQDYCNPLASGCNRSLVPGYALTASNGTSGSWEGPLTMHDCDGMKSLGYTIYVLYTTYYTDASLLPFSNATLAPYVNGTEPSAYTGYDLTSNLQGCASNPSNYAEASVPADIQAALQSMVRAALAGGATLTH